VTDKFEVHEEFLGMYEIQQIAHLVISTLADLREEKMYDLFWAKLLKLTEALDVYDPKVPRQRKRPARYDDGLSTGHHHQTPIEYYRQLYYEVLDNTIHCLTERFDQPGYRRYCQLEQLLIKAGLKEEFGELLQDVCSFYKDDFNPATNATSERSFSGLRRVKNYLRGTMKQDRLNNLMIIHTHKDRTDSLDLKQVANDFVRDNEHRQRIFGLF
jgi:hypothetical protein